MESWKCSPLHARVLALISQLPDKYYTLSMDNLYLSAKCCRLAYAMPQKVMVHGVVRVQGRGVPSNVLQLEVSNKEAAAAARHTVKVAVLKNFEVCTDLVCISLYDTKPVYFMSMAVEKIEWIKKVEKCTVSH